MQAAAGNKLRFIDFSEGILDKALEKNGAFKAVEIPADVYGTAEPGTVIGVNNMLINMECLPLEKIYQVREGKISRPQRLIGLLSFCRC